MFSRASWGNQSLSDFFHKLGSDYCVDESILSNSLVASPAAEHVALLMEQAFKGTGLRFVEAHHLQAHSTPVLKRALLEPEQLANQLRGGQERLRAAGFSPSFDPDDPRPLVLESREARRRRIDPDDTGAVTRLTDRPDDFSPHAALRPIVQAASLPVIAQVCGPSEIVYLGQARPLHAHFDVVAPLLVPRLEATRVSADEIDELDLSLDSAESSSPVDGPLADLVDSLTSFQKAVAALDTQLATRTERFAVRVARDARALAEAPAWRGKHVRKNPRLRPRGRYQDAVLGWLPEAFGPDSPENWAESIIGLSQPLEPPVHVLHSFAEDTP